MRNVRSSSRLLEGGVCPGVVVSAQGVCLLRGVSAQWGYAHGGLPGGLCPRGWGGVSQHALGQTPLWTEWLMVITSEHKLCWNISICIQQSVLYPENVSLSALQADNAVNCPGVVTFCL